MLDLAMKPTWGRRRRQARINGPFTETILPESEFLNLCTVIKGFSHLNKEDLSKIVDLLAEVNQIIKKDIDLEVSQAARTLSQKEGYDEVMGVRPLHRVVN